MKTIPRLLAIGVVCSLPLSVEAQMAVEANAGTSALLKTRNSGTGFQDGIGLHAESKPQPYYGIGVLAEGGYIGIKGRSTEPGTGYRYGGYFEGSGSSFNYGIFSMANGGSMSYAGYFSGNVHVTGTFTNPSDPRLKTKVQPFTGGLFKVLSLQPSSFEYDTTRVKVRGLPQGKQIGLMADEVKGLLPELVLDVALESQDPEGRPHGNTTETYQSVNYMGFIPVLIAAIKEQQAQILALKAELAAFKAK